MLYFSFSHFVGIISNRSSLACITEVLHTDNIDIKGKGKRKETDRGQDVVDLTSDHDDPVPDNGSDEREDHNLVKKLLGAMLGLLYYFMQLMWL